MIRTSWSYVTCRGLIAVAIANTVSASEQAQRPVLPQEVRQQQVQAERSALGEAERLDQSQQLTRQLHQKAQDTLGLVTVLHQNAKSFFTNMETLLDSDRGKRIAREPVAVRLYEDLHKYPAVSLREITERLDTASALVNRLEMAQSGSYVGYVPTQQTQDQVNELQFWAKDRTRSMESNLSVLNDILRTTAETPISPNDKTLRVVLDEIEAAFFKILADHRMKGEEKAAPDVEKIVVDAAYFRRIDRARAEEEVRSKEAEAQVLRMKTEGETALLQQKAQAQRELAEAQKKYDDAMAKIKELREQAAVDRKVKGIDAEIARNDQLTAAERKQKVALAHSDEVKRLLAPFLVHGYSQPNEQMPTYRKGPVSLKKLGAAGALNPSPEGLQNLLWIATDHSDQARPRWGYHFNLNQVSPAEHDQILKAQQYLIDLGQVMVEEGMLAE